MTQKKVFKNMGRQIKQLTEGNKTSYNEQFQRRQKTNQNKGNTALTKREVRRRRTASWDKFVTNLEYETYWTQTKVYIILKQISKDIRKTAKIHGNIDENVFLECYEKIWNTTNINDLKLERNSITYMLE